MVLTACFISALLIGGIPEIFLIIAIILDKGSKDFHSMSPRIAFMKERLQLLMFVPSSFICGFSIYEAIQKEAFTSFGEVSRKGMPSIVVNWVGLILILYVFFTLLVDSKAIFRRLFRDFKSLSEKERLELSKGRGGFFD